MKKEIKIGKEFGNEYEGKYLFESISWGKSNQITSDCTSINQLTKQTKIDLKRMQALMLDATMTERPNNVTLEKLLNEKDGIPMALGELLMSVADYVNGYSEEEREELKKLKQQWGVE